MKKNNFYIVFLVVAIFVSMLTVTGSANAVSIPIPDLTINTKVLTSGRAIAAWPSGIPSGEKRPVLVFLPGWGGSGSVDAAISAQNSNIIPTFTGYTVPALTVGNACVNTATLPGLSVSGINIVADGQPVRLRGVNMGDPFWARNPDWYSMYSSSDYANISQNWKANVVRISIFPTQWKNTDGTTNRATLLAGLAREVNAALNNGLYVIISYHVIGWPDGWYQPAYGSNPVDTYDSNLDVAKSFWTQMAVTYGADTRIIFDLWNEPVHDASDWSGANYWATLKPFYDSLILTVRTNGAQNIVLATGTGWASWLVGIKDNALADANVVYAYHKYSVAGLNTPAEWDKDLGGLIGVKPVIVTEWGYEDSDVTNPTWPGSQASYGDPFTLWMDNHQLSSLAWMYHHDWTPALLKANGSLTLYGTFVKQYIGNTQSAPPVFTDVPYTYAETLGGVSYNLFPYIQALYNAGFTAGCNTSGPLYCPSNTLTRAESAVFMLRSVNGGGYNPPASPSYPAAFLSEVWSTWIGGKKWAEEMYYEGLTAGCIANPLKFCPWDSLPRDQAVVFVLRIKYGNSYGKTGGTPVPAATGTIFADMTDPNNLYTKWAEKAYADNLIVACDTQGGKPKFCPSTLVDRAWAAYMIVKAKGLTPVSYP